MRRVVQSEEISLPEENFGGDSSVTEASRRRSRTVRRRNGRPDRLEEEPNCDTRRVRQDRGGSSNSRHREPKVVAGVPNCGGDSAIHRLGTLRRCGANLSFTAMLLLWSSGLTVGAAVCFILVVTGLVPNRLEPPEAGAVFPKVAARGAQSADTAVGAPEFQVIHEPADVISADLTASADSNDWNQNDALENIPAWDAQTVVSKPELPGGTLPGGALSATGPALSPQPIPSPQPAVADSSEAAAIGAAPDWPPIPVEKNPSDIYLGAAENPAPRSNAPGVPDVSGTAPASGTVPASGTAPEVSDWNQLAAASVSAPKTDLGENAPMKNQINRFDTTAAEVAASEDFYRQAYRQGESTVSGTAVRAQPSSPDPNASPADTPNISANAISTNTVTSAAPVQTVAGGNNFAGYQIRSTQAATAMQPPASGQLR